MQNSKNSLKACFENVNMMSCDSYCFTMNSQSKWKTSVLTLFSNDDINRVSRSRAKIFVLQLTSLVALLL